MKTVAIAAAILVACAAPVRAADDCQLKLVNSIPLTMVDDGRAALLPVGINGTKEMLLLDTGGAATQLTMDAIKALNLPVGDSNVKLLTLGGGAAAGVARVDTFDLGRMRDTHTELLVSPFSFGGDPPVAGIFAADYMAHYDVEFDFAGAKLNYLSQQHCPGKVVYWPAPAAAVVPMRFIDHHLQVQVELNGKPVRAILDTGSESTTLKAPEALRLFSLDENSPDVKVLGGAPGEKRFEKVFDTLTFDGISVAHPHVVIIPELRGKHDPNNDYLTGSRLHREDDPDSAEPTMLIGMNILARLRFVVAFSEGKIYLTPAAAPATLPGP